MNRRSFVKSATSFAALGSAHAAGPFVRPEGPRLRLGLAAYSFRNYFHISRGRPSTLPEEQQIGMHEFIDFCAAQGCDGAELTSYFFDENVTDEALINVRRHAFLRGVDVSGTAVGNNFTHPKGAERDQQMTYVKKWIDRAAILGAPHIRVFAGKHGKELPADEAWANVVENLRTAGDYAATKGIFLGIENHDSVGDHETLLKLVRDADHPWVGVNLDSGNFRTADPYLDIEATAPYAVNVQVKVEFKREGAAEQEETDLERLITILKAANYQGYVILEYEANDNPYEAIPPLMKRLSELCA
tara:strand:- start:3882 stop:4787 length:906 start_codon:yes stop_codon:yes gene_type:complete